MMRLFLAIPLVTLTFACGAIFNSPVPSVECNYALSPFGGGSGTVNDPYAICTVAHLTQVQNYLSSSFKQHADLDLSGNTTLTPVGSTTTPFTGNYDGNGRKISNWTYSTTQDNVGLFGVVSGNAVISNLNVSNFNLTAGSRSGLLLGSSDSNSSKLQISSVYATGQLTAKGRAGGLVGSLSGGSTLLNCGSNVTVSCTSNCGGLVGLLGDGTQTSNSSYSPASVTNCYSLGSVTSSSNGVGGLVGQMGVGSISNSYASGNVFSAGGATGGLVGIIGNSGSSVKNSYSTGDVQSNGFRAGGLVGTLYAGSISSSYSKSNVTVTGSTLQAGGLVGLQVTTYGASSITNSYASGNVNAASSNYVGGLVGHSTGTTATITNSYSLGLVLYGSAPAGGLLGGCSACGAITSSFWDTTTSGIGTSAGGTGLNTSQMQTQSNFTGWDFTSIWIPPSSGVYPTLR